MKMDTILAKLPAAKVVGATCFSVLAPMPFYGELLGKYEKFMATFFHIDPLSRGICVIILLFLSLLMVAYFLMTVLFFLTCLRVFFAKNVGLYIRDGKLIFVYPFILSIPVSGIKTIELTERNYIGRDYIGPMFFISGASLEIVMKDGRAKHVNAELFDRDPVEVVENLRRCAASAGTALA